MRAKTILFVDDEEKSRKYFRRLFRGSFEVMVAEDGSAGLRLFEERRAEIGIVVTDHIMPRFTGLDLLSRIKQSDPEVIRILSTAYVDSKLEGEANRNGVVDHLIAKPWDLERVNEVIEQAAAQFGRSRSGTVGVPER